MSQEKEHLVIRYWPVIVMFITGLITYGTLQARVSDLESSAATQKTDHDLLIKVSTTQEVQQHQLDRIEASVDRLARRNFSAGNP